MPARKSRRPALKLETGYRSRLEEKVAAQLEAAGVHFAYEAVKLKFTVPERTASYTPDWSCPADILIESKGYFRKASDRQRLVLIKEQHPDIDLRLVFQNANKPIYKGSPTTYADWATDHGFLWADGGRIPDDWIKEMKHDGTRSRRNSKSGKRSAHHAAGTPRPRVS